MTSRVTFAEGKKSNYFFKWQQGNLLYKLVSSTNLETGGKFKEFQAPLSFGINPTRNKLIKRSCQSTPQIFKASFITSR
jgi:hypothetical protein